MFNTNWIKWTKASINKYFNDKPRTYNSVVLPLYFGFGDLETNFNEAQYGLQLQIGALRFSRFTKTEERLNTSVRMIIGVKRDVPNIYAKDEISGLVTGMFGNINVLKLVDGDSSLVTCLQMEDTEYVRIFELGESVKGLYNLTIVEADYFGDYDGSS